MERDEIVVMVGRDYRWMAKELLEECGLAGLIGDPAARIGIKPNLVSPTPAQLGATTHPELVAGVIDYLQEKGFGDIVVLEGSWVGAKTMDSFEACGYGPFLEACSVPFIDMQREKPREVDCAGLPVRVGEAALNLDFLINMPVLKGHCQTKVSCALKNMKGLLPGGEKRRFHALGLHDPIARLSCGVRQDFVLVDNISSDLDFEDGGNPVQMDRILAGRDPVLMDAYVCQMLGIDPAEVPYIPLAGKLGVGEADPARARVRAVGGDFGPAIPPGRKVVAALDLVEEVESCSACYAYLVPALEALAGQLRPGVTLAEALGTKICIGQGYRGRQGELGIGNCTCGFSCYLPGCPPLPEEILGFLRGVCAGSGALAEPDAFGREFGGETDEQSGTKDE